MNQAPGSAVLLLTTVMMATAQAAPLPEDRIIHMPRAPYLQSGAPTFDMTISQFREKYNAANPSLPLSEYRAIDAPNDTSHLTRAASRISKNLYSSTALERGSGKIKTLQITWLSDSDSQEKTSREQALAYMTALVHFFEPVLNADQSRKRVEGLLENGQGVRYYQQTEGALRYIVADNGDQGLTFAVEPLKLTLATP